MHLFVVGAGTVGNCDSAWDAWVSWGDEVERDFLRKTEIERKGPLRKSEIWRKEDLLLKVELERDLLEKAEVRAC